MLQPPSLSPLLRVWQANALTYTWIMGNLFSAEKQLDDNPFPDKPDPFTKIGPDISSTTPKVSLFKFLGGGGMGPELIAACIKQTEEFSDVAASKVQFMKRNIDIKMPATVGRNGASFGPSLAPCVIQNATGVRLSFVAETITLGGAIQLNASPWAYSYSPPATIEPGECASFLISKGNGINTFGSPKYEVQVFEGPFAIPDPPRPDGGGWLAPTQESLKIPTFKFGQATSGDNSVVPSTATAIVQVTGGGVSAQTKSTLTWKARVKDFDGGGSYTQYTLTQSLD